MFIVALAAVGRKDLVEAYGATPPFLTFYPAVLLIAMLGGTGPGVLVTLLAAADVAYLNFEPMHPFRNGKAFDIFLLVMFLSIGLTISILAGIVQKQRRRELELAAQALSDSNNQIRLLLDGTRDLAIFMLDPKGHVVSWNPGAERLNGWSVSEIIGQNFSLFYPKDAREARKPERDLKLAAEGSYEEEGERLRKDGSRFWAKSVITALYDDKRNLRGYATVIRDVTARRRAEQETAESKVQLSTIIASAMDAIIIIDENQRIILFNAAAEAMFQCQASEIIGDPIDRCVPHRFRHVHSDHIDNFGTTGITSRAMGKLGAVSGLRSNGEEFPIEASISQAEVDGSKFFAVMLRDITQRKRWEERQSLLQRELSHRVKNTLAVVQSIAAQTRRYATPEQFYKDFTARLLALSHATELLTQSEWEGAGLVDVLYQSLAPYKMPGTVSRIMTGGPDIWLAANEAVNLSLAFHELATNAAKFGALSNETGKINVNWFLDPTDNPKFIELQWRESGGPLVSSPARHGFGSTLLNRAVAHELNGSTKLEFAPLGLECELRFPLSSKVKAQS